MLTCADLCSPVCADLCSLSVQADGVLLALAEPYDACLTACNMQTSANAKYYQYKELGGLGYPKAGGFDTTCTAPDSSVGVPGARSTALFALVCTPLLAAISPIYRCHCSLCNSLHASACSHLTDLPLSLLGCIFCASPIAVCLLHPISSLSLHLLL